MSISNQRALSSISNKANLQQEDTVLSPSLQNVSQLKDWITKMEKENNEKARTQWTRPKNLHMSGETTKINKPRKQSEKVQQIKEQIKIISTPARKKSRNVAIPMNKVQEMKRLLLVDYKEQQAKQKEAMNMSSKKRAQIEQRLNTLDEIQKFLNAHSNHRENSSSIKQRQLDLPMNRVNEMKNWLLEFERQNKEHSKRLGSKSYVNGNSHHYGGVGYATAATKSHNARMSIESTNTYQSTISKAVIETPSTAAVSDLVQFLVDFEQKNKEHFQKSQRKDIELQQQVKSSRMDEVLQEEEEGESLEEDSTVFNEEDGREVIEKVDQQTDEEIGEKLDEEEQEDNVFVENTAILKEAESHMKDVNISMMPATDQSDWEDDYDDLMKIDVNLEPIKSAESWSNESFSETDEDYSKTEDVEEESNKDEDELSSSLSFLNANDKTFDESLSTHDIEEDHQSYDEDNVSSVSGESDVGESFVRAESENLIGQGFIRASNSDTCFSTSLIVEHENDKETNAMKTETVSYINSNTILSDQAPIKNDVVDDISPVKRSSGLKCLYKSWFGIFVPRRERLIEENDEEIKVVYRKHSHGVEPPKPRNIMKKSKFEEDDIEGEEHRNRDGYLHNLYSNAERGGPKDFAREMLLTRRSSCDSPMSLASAFRRAMSPSASSCADSEFSYVETYINGNHRNSNVAQHVGWLKGHFGSPKAIEELKKGEYKTFPNGF